MPKRIGEEPRNEDFSVEKLTAPGKREKINITGDQLERIKGIVRELNAQPFGENEEGGPTEQDWLDTVQYNLNHASAEKLGLSEESIKFIRESGLFLG